MTEAPDKRARKGGGCFTGCLVTVLVLVVLVVAAAFAGKNWVVAKAQEKVPALALVKNAKLDLKGDLSGSTDAADFPNHVHVPDGSKQAAFRTMDDSALAVLRFEGRDESSLIREMKTKMRSLGWKTNHTITLSSGTRILLSKGKQRCQVDVYPSAKGAEAWIQWNRSSET